MDKNKVNPGRSAKISSYWYRPNPRFIYLWTWISNYKYGACTGFRSLYGTVMMLIVCPK